MTDRSRRFTWFEGDLEPVKRVPMPLAQDYPEDFPIPTEKPDLVEDDPSFYEKVLRGEITYDELTKHIEDGRRTEAKDDA